MRTTRLVMVTALAFGAPIVATALTASAASAGPSTIGSLTLTGQIVGKAEVYSSAVSSLGIPLEGCQVGQQNNSVLINLFTLDLRLNGKVVKESDAEVTIQVAKDGASSSLKFSNETPNGVGLQLVAGGSTYLWSSLSGSVELKSKGDGGSVNATLVPAGSTLLHASNSLESGKATSSITIAGSWSSCHAFG
jgi:hypothetical protein